jgi:hypothetical protein
MQGRLVASVSLRNGGAEPLPLQALRGMDAPARNRLLRRWAREAVRQVGRQAGRSR